MSDYFITGTYLADELDKEMEKLSSKAGDFFLYEDVARNPVGDVARKWADALLKNEAFKKADIVIADFSALLSSSDINNAEEGSIDPLVDAFKTLSPDTQVFLISTYIPEFYVIGEEFVMIYHKQPYFEERVRHLNGLEKSFISKTTAIPIDTTKFYFYRKDKGVPLKEGLYEHECYKDIAGKVIRYNEKGIKIPDRPEFDISLDRYIRYAYKVDLFDMPFLFLDLEDLVEMFILSSPVDFARENADELRRLHDLKLPSPWRTMMKPIEKAGKVGKYKIRPYRMVFFLINKNKIIFPYKKIYLRTIKKKLRQANVLSCVLITLILDLSCLKPSIRKYLCLFM